MSAIKVYLFLVYYCLNLTKNDFYMKHQSISDKNRNKTSHYNISCQQQYYSDPCCCVC